MDKAGGKMIAYISRSRDHEKTNGSRTMQRFVISQILLYREIMGFTSYVVMF